MAISTFKGTVPVEDWSQLGNKIDQSVNRYEGLERDRQAKDEQNRKEAEAKYLQQAKVDPIYTASSYWQKEQGKYISDFQNYLGQVYYKSKNKPTLQDQIDIQNHKQALLMRQQRIASDQKKYEMAVAEIKKDPLGKKYDIEHLKSRVNEWINPDGNGELADDLLLAPLIQDLKAHNIAKKYSGKMQTNETVSGNIKTTVESVPEDQRRAHVIEDIYNDSSEMRSATKLFNELPEKEKQERLAKYPAKKSDKAITDWYYDNYGKYAYPDIVNKGLAPRGRSGGKSAEELISGQVSEEPTDTFTLGTTNLTTKKTNEAGEVTSKKSPILTDVDKYGKGITFAPGKYGSVISDSHIDMDSGHLTPVKSSTRYELNDPQILHVPYYDNYGISPTGKYDKETSNKIKGIVVFKDDDGKTKGLELTDEVKRQIIAKHPALKDKLNEVKNEFIPKGDNNSEKTTEAKTQVPSQKYKNNSFSVGGKKLTYEQVVSILKSKGKTDEEIQKLIEERYK
jgi:hypothetical protein